jgi:NADP-dependent 3-hydroxy acid dehydrogenase YdfG
MNKEARSPYFADKKILITGASSGVGMALGYWYILLLDLKFSYRYLNNGAQVALVGRDIETLSKIGE